MKTPFQTPVRLADQKYRTDGPMLLAADSELICCLHDATDEEADEIVRLINLGAKAAVEKSAMRTRRWVWVCQLVERSINDGTPRDMLIEYTKEEADKAEQEGYNDTAEYLRHILNDLQPAAKRGTT